MPTTRKTYVVSVHEYGGAAIVEEVRTGRKARLGALGDAGPQIERWLRDSGPTAPDRDLTDVSQRRMEELGGRSRTASTRRGPQ
jgi:hypothetical protein